jgi:hypothetical protein
LDCPDVSAKNGVDTAGPPDQVAVKKRSVPVNNRSSMKTGTACVFAVVLVSFSLGCTPSTQVPNGRQYHKFVRDESLLANYPQGSRRGGYFTGEQLLIVSEFLEWLSSQREGINYVLGGSRYTMDGSAFAVITATNATDTYFLLEVSGEERTLKYTSIPVF